VPARKQGWHGNCPLSHPGVQDRLRASSKRPPCREETREAIVGHDLSHVSLFRFDGESDPEPIVVTHSRLSSDWKTASFRRNSSSFPAVL